MEEEKYSFTRLPEEYYYEFFSDGPKGKIRKVVCYRLIEEVPNRIFNLGFGDWEEKTGDVNDRIITNNHDRQKVLATIAETVLEFTKDHSGAFVFAQGSTASRTRLYQIGIVTFLDEIGSLFMLLGYADGKWGLFEKGKNYEAFLIKRK